MRKVILRFVFDNLWQWQSAGNEFHIGAAWFMLLWIAIVAVAFCVLYSQTKKATESAMSAGFWLIVPVALAAAWLFQLPIVKTGIPVFGYGLMMFLGFSSATWLASRRVLRIGQPPEAVWDMMMWALIPGLIGARIIYIMQNSDQVFSDQHGIKKHGFDLLIALIALWDGGIVFYGSVIGGICGVIIYCRRRRIQSLAMLDVIAPSMFIGEGFGRLGCFLYGCCYGKACDLPWAVKFPPDSLTFEKLSREGRIIEEPLSTIPLHPTQLYSAFAAFTLAAILAWYFRRRSFDGAVLALGLILYPINRFLLETLRDDEPKRWGTSFTFSQLVSIALLLSGVAAMYFFSRRKILTKATVAATQTKL